MRVYNWNELPREKVGVGIQRCAFRGENVLLVYNEAFPGKPPRPHSHPFEQVVLILQGRTRWYVGDEVFEAGPGSVFRIPPDVVHSTEILGDEMVVNLDVFSPIRADYLHLVEYQEDFKKP